MNENRLKIVLIAIIIHLGLSIIVAIKLNAAEGKIEHIIRTQERPVTVEQTKENSEQAAMLWWSGADDLHGARERLCKNYYPRKGDK
jgi:hypothetical protein